MRARRWFEPDCGQTTHDMSRRALEQPRSVAEAQLLQERLRDQAIWTIPCAGMNHRGQIDRIPVRQPDTIVRLCFFDNSWFRRPMNSIRSFFTANALFRARRIVSPGQSGPEDCQHPS